MEECKNCIEKIEGLIPAARNQQLELERAMLENIKLKASLYM
jgi:hypothetical protein